MTTGPSRILDDFARLMTDAAGAAQGVRQEFETAFRSQAERVLNTMDVVKREEFEAVRDMAITGARGERPAARAHRGPGGKARGQPGAEGAVRALQKRRLTLSKVFLHGFSHMPARRENPFGRVGYEVSAESNWQSRPAISRPNFRAGAGVATPLLYTDFTR